MSWDGEESVGIREELGGGSSTVKIARATVVVMNASELRYLRRYGGLAVRRWCSLFKGKDLLHAIASESFVFSLYVHLLFCPFPLFFFFVARIVVIPLGIKYDDIPVLTLFPKIQLSVSSP